MGDDPRHAGVGSVEEVRARADLDVVDGAAASTDAGHQGVRIDPPVQAGRRADLLRAAGRELQQEPAAAPQSCCCCVRVISGLSQLTAKVPPGPGPEAEKMPPGAIWAVELSSMNIRSA